MTTPTTPAPTCPFLGELVAEGHTIYQRLDTRPSRMPVFVPSPQVHDGKWAAEAAAYIAHCVNTAAAKDTEIARLRAVLGRVISRAVAMDDEALACDDVDSARAEALTDAARDVCAAITGDNASTDHARAALEGGGA